MNNARNRGFTLIELMIVTAVIAVLAAIAYPSYQNYVTKTRRSIGTSTLMQVSGKQEQFYLDNKQYASDLSDLGYPGNPFFVDSNTQTAAADSSSMIYKISVTRPTITTYTLSAVPVNLQLESDTKCGTLTLNSRGTKGSSAGTVDDCW